MNIISYFALNIFYALFPKRCLFCNNILEDFRLDICPECESRYQYPQDNIKSHFTPLGFYTEDVYVLARYRYSKKTVKSFKFNGNINKGKKFSALLCRNMEKLTWIKDIDFVIPVPLHKVRLSQRGFNQSEVIANEIAKTFGKKVIANNLYRIRNNKSQYISDPIGRYDNVKNNFALKDKKIFEGKTILLVDDVITTCATTTECCKCLKQVKDIKIYVCCLSSERKEILL